MSTNNRGRKFKSEIQQPQVIEDVKPEIISDETLITEEQVVAQEEFINEPIKDEIDAKIEETIAELQELPDVAPIEAEKEKLEEVTENVFAFQKDYFLVNDGKSAVIDVLPSDPPVVVTPLVAEPLQAHRPRRKTLQQLTACELNIYHKTGILPLL